MLEIRSPHSPITYPGPLAEGQEIHLGGKGAEKLRFRQMRPSEAFTLQDASGDFFRARLNALEGGTAEALVYEKMLHPPESPLRLTLVCAFLARQRMFPVLQKATELGATWILPAYTEHSAGPEVLDHEKGHAWPNVIQRAYRQCRRATVPDLRPIAPLGESLRSNAWRESELCFYLDDRAESAGFPTSDASSVAFASGPEGGWSDAERELLGASGARPLSLGGRVLRAETAVLTGLVLLQHHYGDLAPVQRASNPEPRSAATPGPGTPPRPRTPAANPGARSRR